MISACRSNVFFCYTPRAISKRASVMWRWCLLFLCLIGSSGWAAIDTHEFENDVQRVRYYSFIDEMRCPKCQNQNLSGSDSPIATDLRGELYEMSQDGRSDHGTVDVVVDRCGQ